MKCFFKMTIISILAFMFSLFIEVSAIKASDYIYYDNSEEVTISLEQNPINTYKDFLNFVSETNNVPISRLAVYKYTEDLGYQLAELYNTYEGDNTPFLEFLPSTTCYITYYYNVNVVLGDDTVQIKSNGHYLNRLNSISKKGYKFKGWYTLEGEEYVKYDFQNNYIDSDGLTLYPLYTKEKNNTIIIILASITLAFTIPLSFYLNKKKKLNKNIN